MKLLKKLGKLVRRNGRLVRTDNPANCDCCGPPPNPPCYFCNAAFPDNIQTVNLPNDVCLDQGGFIDLALAQGACKPPPPTKCCAVCDEPLVGGICPPGFLERDGKCVKEIDYNCDPGVFAQIIADYPECKSGFKSNNSPCPPPQAANPLP